MHACYIVDNIHLFSSNVIVHHPMLSISGDDKNITQVTVTLYYYLCICYICIYTCCTVCHAACRVRCIPDSQIKGRIKLVNCLGPILEFSLLYDNHTSVVGHRLPIVIAQRHENSGTVQLCLIF